ncbi:odorant receptor 67d isoform X1 [Culex quinquefasciatus]|uniref:odorant receptor 67d isoform X1 n=1 Tax=Culex quinquefasciatus TaxID=7176 RepID=UPI0018E3203F|nr:odorant receptor 67d isoform X1 [Culex quinquefasciatus]
MTYRRPLQVFERITSANRWVLKLLGIDVFNPNFRYSTATWVIWSLASFFILVTGYDLYRFRNDVFNFAFALVTLGYAVIGVSRLGFFLGSPAAYSQIFAESKETYRQESSERSREVQQKYTIMLKQCVMLYSGCFLGGCIIAGVLPFAVYWWTEQKVLPFGVILPFTDPDTMEGYQLNYLYQVSCIAWTPPGLTATQNMYFALVFNICIQYDVLQLKLEDLDKLIEDTAEYSVIQQKLVEIIHCQQHLSAFVTEIERIFAVQMFIEISSMAMQIVVILFVEHIDLWIPGYLAIIVATFQLLIFCALGTFISIKADLFAESVYNVSWHQIRIPEQQSIKFMMAKSQQSLLLTFGGMLPLDMNLFLSVYRKIYSIFMMLQNV